ncbi:MAG: type II toxin-antitoxin system VapC family toxin [Pseudohongiellaceae bacterium]
MIGLDTNVLVRYITQDDAVQAKKASTLIEALSPESPGYITVIVLVELVWVLQGAYQASREQLVEVVETLLRNRELIIEQSDTVWQALRMFSSGKADFADCMIASLASAAGCDYVATFDRNAAKMAGMKLIG